MDKNIIFLPRAFEDSMKKLLGAEYDEFRKSYENSRYVGLRFNPLKCDRDSFLENVPFKLEPVDWAFEGFYYNPEERPGKHPLHEAGAYYIQEPSAMSAVSALDPKPGECILDMCAAPGGKSTQIAGRLSGKGLLVSNEIIRDRAKVLSSNIERMGVSNALVVSESPDSLSPHFLGFFDKILVDAPCSGEGMFKKEENALIEWSEENVKMCHERQLMILSEAAIMLKCGGTLVFSTCTFNDTENEGTVNAFTASHPEFTVVMEERFWPHKIKGEGHFVAVLKKEGMLSPREQPRPVNNSFPVKDIIKFLVSELGIKSEYIENLLEGRQFAAFGENIYLLPPYISSLSGLKVERAGLQLCVSKKNRYEPTHALALSLRPSDCNNAFALSDEEAEKYIKGETIPCPMDLKGWVLLSVRGFSIGWGKASGGIIKNHYPKGLRK